MNEETIKVIKRRLEAEIKNIFDEMDSDRTEFSWMGNLDQSCELMADGAINMLHRMYNIHLFSMEQYRKEMMEESHPVSI